MRSYVELQISSNFSFLQGASHPAELAQTAKALGYTALGISDRNTLAGVVRAHVATKEVGIRLVVGARLDFADGTPSFLCYPKSRQGYAALASLLTQGKMRAPKGACFLHSFDLLQFASHQNLILVPPDDLSAPWPLALLSQLKACPGVSLGLAASFLFSSQSAKRLAHLNAMSQKHNLALVATNDVHAHSPERRMMQDVLTCIREHCSIKEAGFRLHANKERYLKPIAEMNRLFARYLHALDNAVEIADSCQFSLDELQYQYPNEPIPVGQTADSHLAQLADNGAKWRYPKGVPLRVHQQIQHELALIRQLGYAPYFLTVHDIVSFAQKEGILCQGRGSAANSAVCYCLGITAVDPSQHDLLFERFISAERDEPPDIDVDFENDRREEVMQYIYQRFGRHKAAICATVITYRKKSALRDVGKALGIPLETIERLLVALKGYSLPAPSSVLLTAGLNDAPDIQLTLQLATELLRFPRHLSQHVGGFVITESPLCELVPIGNAAMDERTFIEWDKDDLEAMKMLKIDVLALGMLSCIKRCFELIKQHHKRHLCLASVPKEDQKVYAMLEHADSLGVFQIESRAQMSMLPRIKPRCFYDLVIQVAIVRPGPIQGDMVHPYLRRRNGEEAVTFPSVALESVLGKTLGVPLFQEQAMRIAVVAAGFSPGHADKLRRAMAAYRHSGTVHCFRDEFVQGMIHNGYEPTFAERCFNQILGFGEYGFPESHAASFALLVYVSAWLKAHYPAEFAAALLNSQPMGFYQPAQIIDDAKRHHVRVLPIDVNHSAYDNTLEAGSLRLGFREIRGLLQTEAQWVVACRGKGYTSVKQLAQRSGVQKRTLQLLAKANALASLQLERRQALWAALGTQTSLPLFETVHEADDVVLLPDMSELEHVTADFHSMSFSLRSHPVSFLRERLRKSGHVQCQDLKTLPNRSRIQLCGLVIIRQRPMTAKGVIFQTLEDETGFANIVIWPSIFEQFRLETLSSPFLSIEGVLERKDGVAHLIAHKMKDMSPFLARLPSSARDFR